MASINGEEQPNPAYTNQQDADMQAIAGALGMTVEEATAYGLLAPQSTGQSAPGAPDQSMDFDRPVRQAAAQRPRRQFWRRQEG
jgi:hypothetical protein